MKYSYPVVLALISVFYGTDVLLAQCPVTVSAGDDVYMCAPPSPAQLNGDINGDYLNFFWTPTAGMQGSNTLNPTVNVSNTTNYVLTVRAADLSNNLITNGDFESGNSDFTSDYVYNPGNLVPEGYYDVLDNPQDDHPGFAACNDHTSGSGNMMVVNGAGTPNQNVWCQTVTVTPNTQYVFSAWVTSVVAASPALLQFSINGSPLGNIFSAPGGTCNWQNFFQTWNSGGNGSATICIVNQNTTLGGNDFALDDILFAPTCLVSDTVTVHVVSVTAAASPALSYIPCDGANTTLSGAGSSAGPNVTYSWDSPSGNIVSGQNTLNPVVNAPGTYTLTVTYDNGQIACTKTASVTVALNPSQLTAWINPPQPIGCGGNTVTLIGNTNQLAFAAFEWTANPGNIVSGANSKNAVIDQPGTYTLVVTNTNTGCTATSEVTVGTANNPPIANAGSFGTITCIVKTAPLLGTGSSSGPNISYAWTTPNGVINSGQNSLNAVAGAGGTYILAVTNSSNNCIAYDTVTVPANIDLPTVSIQAPGVLDCDTDTLTLSANASPAGLNLAWSASGGGQIVAGQNTPNPTVITAGTYSVIVTNPANGCTAGTSANVTSNYVQPVAVAQTGDTLTCQQPSTTLSGSGSSNGANINYQWTASPGGNIVSGHNTLSPVVNAAGVYTLLVTNTSNGCTALATASVAADTNIVVAVANAPDTLDCLAGSVVLNANGSSNGPAMTYLWTTADGSIGAGANTPNPTANQPGTYQLLLTNTANGCSATDLAVVVQNTALPNIAITAPDTLTCANPVQTITAQNGSLPGSFLYHWVATSGGNIVSGQDSLLLVVNTAGTYTLTATNTNNGCTTQSAVDVAIEVGTPVALIAAPNPLTCAQASQALNTAGSSSGLNYAYQWTTGNGHFVSADTLPVPVVDQPGVYTLLITNTSNGCTATDTVTVNQNTTPPPADAGPAGLLTCTTPLFILSANGGQAAGALEIQWSTSGGNFTGNPDSIAVSVDAAGDYFLLVTDTVNGCTAADTVQVTANQHAPQFTLSLPDTLSCAVTTVSFAASFGAGAAYTTQWQTDDGNFTGGADTPSPSVDLPGIYSLLVTDTVNGCTKTGSVLVLQDIGLPVVQIQQPDTITCANPSESVQSQNLSLPGSFSYAWSATAGGNIVSGANTLNPVVNAGGDYMLAVTNLNNGCTNVYTVSIGQNTALPAVDAGANDTLSCSVSALNLAGSASATGALSYLWTASNGGHIVSGQNTANPQVDKAGNYTLLVTDTGNGCTATDAVQVFNDVNAPQANAGPAPTLTCAVTQTTLNATASTGPNFTYSWSAANGGNILSGQNTLNPLISEPGTYTLTVTNLANGCSTTAQTTASENVTVPPVGTAPAGPLTCAVTSLTLSGQPATGNYSWLWQTGNGAIVSGANTPNPVVNSPGAYSLFVTDLQNGCSATALTIVSENLTAPDISASQPAMLTCAVPTVQLSGTVTQPASGYSATWISLDGHIVSGENTLMPIVDEPGHYIMIVENTQNGCADTTAVNVAQDITPPVAAASAPDLVTCANPSVGLSGTGSSEGPGFTYAWTGSQILSGQNTLAPVVAAAGPYSLTVTNTVNGCVSVAVTVVQADTAQPVFAMVLPEVLTCVRTQVTLSANLPISLPDFTASWVSPNGHFVSGQNTLFPVVDKPGNYVLTVTNLENGCQDTQPIAVSQNITPPGADAGPPAELHCNQPEVALEGDSPASGNMQYAWTTSNGNIVSGVATASPLVDEPGAYDLTVTDPGNGCTSTDVVTITEAPPPAFEPEVMQPNCKEPKGAVDFGAVSGGKAPFRYSKDGGQNFSTQAFAGNLSPGAYQLVVSDAYGCTDEADVQVDEPFLPTVTLPDYIALEMGELIYLEPALNQPILNIVSWQWTPADGLSCSDCPYPIATPLRSANYTVHIVDANGCEAQARVQLRVDRRRYIYAPNIFTPDGDGVNDKFTLYGRGVREVRRLQVFDRWGAEIFLVEDLDINDEVRGWDGTFRGHDLNPAVFVWQAVVEFEDGEVEVFAGDVTVKR